MCNEDPTVEDDLIARELFLMNNTLCGVGVVEMLVGFAVAVSAVNIMVFVVICVSMINLLMRFRPERAVDLTLHCLFVGSTLFPLGAHCPRDLDICAAHAGKVINS